MRPNLGTYKAGQSYKFSHFKFDGIFISLERTRTGINAWTRTYLTNHAELVAPLIPGFMNAAVGTRFYGELYCPGEPASEVLTKRTDLKFVAFASPQLPKDAALPEVETHAYRHGLDFATFFRGMVDVSNIDLPPDIEGIVFKDGNLLNWVKWKPTPTMDLRVVGYKSGRGKFIGKVGSLRCKSDCGSIDVFVGGMTDEMRDEISENRDKYVGRIVEVAYQYVGSGGGLRHPRFVRWRDDKNATSIS